MGSRDDAPCAPWQNPEQQQVLQVRVQDSSSCSSVTACTRPLTLRRELGRQTEGKRGAAGQTQEWSRIWEIATARCRDRGSGCKRVSTCRQCYAPRGQGDTRAFRLRNTERHAAPRRPPRSPIQPPAAPQRTCGNLPRLSQPSHASHPATAPAQSFFARAPSGRRLQRPRRVLRQRPSPAPSAVAAVLPCSAAF